MNRWSNLAFAITAVLSSAAYGQVSDAFTVSDIRVDGLGRISEGTVYTYLPIERGDQVSQSDVAEAIRRLYATGFFSDIKISRQNNILVVDVKERPAINKITFVGNKDIKTEELMKGVGQAGLAEGDTFERKNLEELTQELTRAYNNRGKYNVSVEPAVVPLSRNRVNLTVTVKEGKVAKIRHINIVGNKAFSEEDIRDRWEQDTTNWLSWYSRDDQYSQEKVSGDLEKLNAYYLDRGYVDFNIDSTQVAISPDRRDISLVTNISEGEVYTISGVEVSGETILPKEEMEKYVFIKEGQTFSRRLLELTSDSMVNTLSNIGYAFAEVEPLPRIDREKKTVGINFHVKPGPRARVRRIVFQGNTRTSDEVLRREMRQFEGMWYSQAALDRSKVRLQRVGFFKNIDFETSAVPGSDDEVDVIVTVVEQSSGSFQFGLGFSQISGVMTNFSVQENNFFGTGNRVGLSVARNKYSKQVNISFLDPYFTDDGMSLGYNVWYRTLDQRRFNVASYTSDNAAFQAIWGLPITETDTIGWMLGIDYNTITTTTNTPKPIVDYINDVGRRTFHAWRTELNWQRDTRNAYFSPTAGSLHSVSLEATLPGSTQEYLKLRYKYGQYWPLSHHLVLFAGADLGWGGGYGNAKERGLPFFENFYAGGMNGVRGFDDNTLGPVWQRIPGQSFRQPLGGALKTTGSIELFFPTLLDTDAARLSSFVDFGNVFKDADAFDFDDFRVSAGVALEWQAPIGAVKISVSQPLKYDKELDRTQRIQFSFGNSF